jgi:hypothetical protein
LVNLDTFRIGAQNKQSVAFQTVCVSSQPLSNVSAEGDSMLKRRSPSAITTKITCAECSAEMPLTLVEPAWDGRQVNNHVFTCGRCGKRKSTGLIGLPRLCTELTERGVVHDRGYFSTALRRAVSPKVRTFAGLWTRLSLAACAYNVRYIVVSRPLRFSSDYEAGENDGAAACRKALLGS